MVSLSDENIKSRAFDYNIVKRFLPYVAIGVKVNLEGWWHPRRHIRKAEGEEYE